jgi:hypothetical protein
VAAVSGTVLALAAGARRTSVAPDAFTADVGGDADALVLQQSGAPRTADVAALPGVASVEARTFVFAGLLDYGDGAPPDSIAFAGSRAHSSSLVAGRDPDPANPGEFVADQRFVAASGARLGDRYRLVTLTREQISRGAFQEAPRGPTFDAELVGIVAAGDVLDTNYRTVVFSPALLGEGVEVARTIMTVRLDEGVTTDQLRAALDALPDGSAFSVTSGQVVSAEVRNAVDAQGRATWLMAAVVFVAALVALGQLLTRHVRVSDGERGALRALGFTRGLVATETIMRAAVPAVVGISIGVAVAVLASGLFPAGFVRVLEPDPGLHVDVGVRTGTAGLLLVGVLGWVTVAVLTGGAIRARRTPPRAGAMLLQRAPSPAAATGTRFALTTADGSIAPAIGTLLALAVIVAGVVGTGVFAASGDRLVSDRGRFGSNYDFAVGTVPT